MRLNTMILIGDMETNGLQPDKIWCIILKEYMKENYYGFVPKEYLEDSKKALSNVVFDRIENFSSFVDASKRLVFHNGCGFDFRVFKKLLNITVTNYRDTYVMSKLASPKREGGHSIEEWAKRLGTTDQKLQLEDSDWNSFSIKLLQRCYSDLRIGEAVYSAVRRELKETTLNALDIEQKTAWLVADQIENGVKLDIPKVHQLYTECKLAANKIQKDISKFFPPKPIKQDPIKFKLTKKGEIPVRLVNRFGLDIVGDSTPLEYEFFNLDSPKQRVEKLLELGWQPLEFTKKTDKGGGGSPKFTEESLLTIPEDAPKELLQLADYLMLRSRERTFQQWLDKSDRNNFIHGYVDPLGTRTQRMSHSGPNLGNIARTEYDKETEQPLLGLQGRYGYESRDCFVRSSEETILVGCDAKGIQLRGLSHYCEDPDYITLISDPRYDPHTTHAEALGLSRPLAKTWCVPYSTEILTRTGWKKREQLDLTDVVMGYCQKSDSLQWTKLTAIHDFEEKPLVKMHNSRWQFICTEEHRWPTLNRKTKKFAMKETSALSYDDNIINVAPFKEEKGSLDLSLSEVRLIAWLATDGYWKWYSPKQLRSDIIQHEKKFAEEIRLTLSEFIRSEYQKKCVSFYLDPKKVKPLFDKLNWNSKRKKDIDWVSFVLSMNEMQLNAWVDTCFRAEGTLNKGDRVLSQNFGSLHDAIALGEYLLGRRIGFGKANEKHGIIRASENKYTTKGFLSVEKLPPEKVWCVSTELDTFVARQGTTITITGNCYSWLMGAAETKLGSIVIPKEPKKFWRDRGAADLERFYKRFPFIKDFKKTLARWANRGYMFTLHGSKLEIPSEHLAMATALQSFEANIIKKALILFTDELNTADIPYWLRLIVHDEFLVETALDKGKKVGHTIGTSIIRSGEILKSKCPMDFDVKYGHSWAKVH